MAPAQVPVVDYLVLDGERPHLVGNRCTACGATYLARRNACSSCGALAFERVDLPDAGRIESYTVVVRGAPRATGPFVSVLVRLDDGTYVKANLLGVAPDAGAVDLAAPVSLQTYVAGVDEDGTEAVAFGYAYEGAVGA
jgi:uncharacterized OB-fold protein